MSDESEQKPEPDETDGVAETADTPDGEADEGADQDVSTTLNPRKKNKSEPPVDPGATLLYEPGGSWWVVAIGPVLIIATLIMEILGKGRIHWEVLTIFGVVLIGFSLLQVIAARQHVSMRLTETTLREGTETIEIADIVKIFPENTGPETQDWESAPALGELHAVPRRRKGIGLRLANGRLVQAWARDVGRLRIELTEAHMAVKMGLPPRGNR
ncbi:hypothetical protein [Gordonia neofelifaecis]|uniref:Transmembrane protein n=1 Tax=Gordonia neofelifaecis NRRL B-59395 TaxID=644548 RepID=F1YIQ3_9ACTN|nr:hypothetical protein [Gordonia neofelifaecis]EGD55361.1 hypothetical protein SCNU_08886 [Gordonia neofelifaecis NRRL B-59395]